MKRFVLFFAFFSTAFWAVAQDQKRVQSFNLEKGLAVQGYDVVAYFSGKPVKGNASFAAVYQGVRYHFANEANKETFKKNAAKYEPQYGGWCAYAMGANGEKVEIKGIMNLHLGKIK